MNDYIRDIIGIMKDVKVVYGQDSLSVEEVLENPTLEGCKVLGGAAGLQNRCKHMTILKRQMELTG